MGNPTPPGATIATIPDLPSAGVLSGGELIWINQAGLDKSATASSVAALAGAGVYLPLTGGSISGSLSVSGGLTVGGSASGTTPSMGDNSAAFATTAFVQNAISGVSGVSTFNGRNGAVVLTSADVTGVGGATSAQLANYLPLAGGAISGALSVGGGLTATTPAPGDNTTKAATTAFVATALGGYLPLTGGAIGGPTTAPTPTAGDNSTNVATTAFVHSAVGAYLPLAGGTLTGNLTISAASGNSTLTVNGAAGSQRSILGATNGTSRWLITPGDSTAETGSNAGSNFGIVSIADSGSALLTVLGLNRATGAATFGGDLTVNGNIYQTTAQLFRQTSTQPTHGLNKTTTAGNSWIMGQTNGNNRWLLYLADSTAEPGSNVGGNAALVACNDAGAYNISAWSVARNTGVVTFSQPIVNGSDLRQKRDITPLSDALTLVKQLAGVSYERVSRPGRRELGLIAQDVAKIIPEAVQECCPEPREAPNRVGTDEEPVLGISYNQFTALLIEAVKELAAEVEALKARAATGVPLI